MQFSAIQIAALIQGTIEGDAQVLVNGFGKIETATQGQLSFLANPKYEEYLYTTQASVIIINQSLTLKQPVNNTLIRVADAYSAFALLLAEYQKMQAQQLTGIHPQSFIAPTAKLDAQVYVASFVTIGDNATVGANSKLFSSVVIGKNVIIGNNTVIHPNVTIYDDCVIGNNVVIHAGTVIGSDGFGFAPQADGAYKKIPQMGNVIIENDVEIGANSTIDRATIGSTIIKQGVKLDNLVQVAHNVEIGSHSVIAAQAGISGSTKLGKYLMVGGQVGFAGHITIADGTKIGGQSGITKSIKQPNTSVYDTPAFDYKSSLRSQIVYKNLPELLKRVEELEKKLELLSPKSDS